MVQTLAPSLVYVIGIPFGLLLLGCLLGTGVFVALGRSRRG